MSTAARGEQRPTLAAAPPPRRFFPNLHADELAAISRTYAIVSAVAAAALVITTVTTIADFRVLWGDLGLLVGVAAVTAWKQWVFYHYTRAPRSLQLIRLHWRDCRYARTLADEDRDIVTSVATLYDSWRNFPNLRYVHDVAKAIHPVWVRTLADAEVIAALRRADLPASAAAVLLYEHMLSAHAIFALFDRVPDLTPADLYRFSQAAPLPEHEEDTDWDRIVWDRTDWDRFDQYAAHYNAAYRAHGERASYYAALRMSPAEQDTMTAEQVPMATLKAMAALTMDPVG